MSSSWPPGVKPPRIKVWAWLKAFTRSRLKRWRLFCYLRGHPLVDLITSLQSPCRVVEHPIGPRMSCPCGKRSVDRDVWRGRKNVYAAGSFLAWPALRPRTLPFAQEFAFGAKSIGSGRPSWNDQCCRTGRGRYPVTEGPVPHDCESLRRCVRPGACGAGQPRHRGRARSSCVRTSSIRIKNDAYCTYSAELAQLSPPARAFRRFFATRRRAR